MTKLTTLCIVFFLFSVPILAQQASIKGNVVDTSNKENLRNAVVSILRATDSILVKFTRTDAKGYFEINNLPTGKIMVLISYPSYVDYVDVFELNENEQKDLGSRPLILKAKLLEEVIVQQKVAAIRLRGDTTEYKADSFRVGANANVQDLLKKMPGIQVNSKGEITTQGQKVEKILVDGEEFFSDDPAVVSQTLRADAVDKVQVYDKKSDQAVFSGIDDGEKTKTINLQLKEDKKKGYFGKTEAGTDFNQYKTGKVMANSFKGKRKLAGYITYDNTRFESLDWNDRNNYGGNMNTNTEVGDDGGIYMYNEGDEFSWGQGLPSAITGGLLFSKKWGKDKHNFNGNYQFNQLEVQGKTTSIDQKIFEDTAYIETSIKNFVSNKQRNRIRGVYDFAIDSSSSLKATLNAGITNINNKGTTTGAITNLDGSFINQTQKTISSISDNKNLTSNIFYRKRFKKKGRTISVNADFGFTDNNNEFNLDASNQFYNKFGTITTVEVTDQFKPSVEKGSNLSAKVSYTEPLWKNTFLELNYRYANSKNDAEKNTFNKDFNGNFTSLVDSLSNHFIFNTHNNNGGFTLRYNAKKFNFSIGSGLGRVVFNQTDVNDNTNRKVGFTNFLPTATIGFTPTKQKRFTLTYNGSTRNPSILQIQPIIDNIDPLNINVGNPNLKQEFRNTFSLNFSDYKIIKSRNIWLSANFTTINNAISSSVVFNDSTLKRENKTINVDGNYNGNMWSQFGFDVAPSMNLSFGFNPNISRFVNFINNQKNTTDNVRLGYSINLGYWPDKWLNFYFNIRANSNRSTSSINKNIVTRYWTYNSYGEVNMKLPKKWYITLEEEINVYEKTSIFANQRDIFIINASVKKSIDKDENWQVKLSGNDILKQNQSVSRNISSNVISETTNQNIQRFFLLTLIYNFSKNGKPSN